MVEEARLEQLEAGLTPVTDGWFVVSVPDAAWVTNEALGAACVFQCDDASWPAVGRGPLTVSGLSRLRACAR
jgi:hypothetical protein